MEFWSSRLMWLLLFASLFQQRKKEIVKESKTEGKCRNSQGKAVGICCFFILFLLCWTTDDLSSCTSWKETKWNNGVHSSFQTLTRLHDYDRKRSTCGLNRFFLLLLTMCKSPPSIFKESRLETSLKSLGDRRYQLKKNGCDGLVSYMMH